MPSWKRWTPRSRQSPRMRRCIMPRRPRRLARRSCCWTRMDGCAPNTAFRVFVIRNRAMPQRNGNGQSDSGSVEVPKPPTSDDLKDLQLATTFTHQALGVREALLKAGPTRKRILAMILHDKVRSEALAIRLDVNNTTINASNGEGFIRLRWTRCATGARSWTRCRTCPMSATVLLTRH